MSFETLGLIEPILKAVRKEGYTTPTPIQAQAIPPLLERRDLLGCAQTGTGKTAAFAIPILQHLSGEAPSQGPRRIRALVLSPTRELAVQIGASFSAYGAFLRLKNAVVVGGVSQNTQKQALTAGVDILVATPGRLIDFINQGCVDLHAVRFLVLDEADQMLDMGFIRDVERIIAQLPGARQTMLFSATMPPEIAKLADKVLKNPAKVAVTPVASTVDTIGQSVYFVNKSNKTKLLIHLLSDRAIVSALVFSRTKHGANKIAKELDKAGVTCDVIHSNKAQSARQLALGRFKSRQSRVLVATDIVARGIDIDELSHVVNYDLPEVPEAYVHRIGRTGRAGLGGTAISFCTEDEKKLLRDIEKLIAKKIPVVQTHPFPLVPEQPPANAPAPRQGPGRSRPAGQPSAQPQPQRRGAVNPPASAGGGAPAGAKRRRRPRRPAARS